jgi:hypothetical protein
LSCAPDDEKKLTKKSQNLSFHVSAEGPLVEGFLMKFRVLGDLARIINLSNFMLIGHGVEKRKFP